MSSGATRIATLAIVGIATAAVVGASVPSPGNAYTSWPGLPTTPVRDTVGSVQKGITQSTKARQWARVPLTMVNAGYLWTSSIGSDSQGNYTQDKTNATAFLVSPDGSKDAYGSAPAITVRTVAFGSIPVEATLEVSQLRDSDDLPDPINIQMTRRAYSTRIYVDGVALSTSLKVAVTRLVVDGVQLKLPTEGCRTREVATLEASSEAYDYPSGLPEAEIQTLPWFDSSKNFNETLGGTLKGTIDVPPFASCLMTDTHDDLGPVLTASISADGNPLTLRTGPTTCQTLKQGRTWGPGPGEDTPTKAKCEPFSVPGSDVVPPDFPFPNS
jgi:hypothetical protein